MTDGGLGTTVDFAFLHTLGWDAFFSAQLHIDEGDGQSAGRPGRVIGDGRRHVRVQIAPEHTLLAEVSGRFAHESASRKDFPGVGDWVICEPTSATHGIIHRVLERKTLLLRRASGEKHEEQVLAANVDTVFIVTSLNNDFNPRRLERYLAMVRMGRATPVILLTKADLCEDPAPYLDEARRLAPDAITIQVSGRTGEGIDALAGILKPATTSVLLGSSGVGKSTLINRLFGFEVAKTGEIREDDDRGRHTTTGRQLWMSPTGAMVIDTPGMRELQLWDDGDVLGEVFADIEELALQCKFTDCRHDKEPGCRIRAALDSGELPRQRLESYHKLQAELAAHRRKTDKEMAARERQKWKKLTSDLAETIKRKRR